MIADAVSGALVGAGVFLAVPRTRGVAVDTVAGVLKSRAGGGRRRSSTDEREKVEAIACWTEQLRDTISASGGLIQAIGATVEVSPAALSASVRRLDADLAYLDPATALRRFADRVDHPSCDLVVAALLAAQRHPVRDLAQLLGHLSECAREESRAHLRIWVSRARTRRAVRIITTVVVTFVAGLIVVSPGYLADFTTSEGLVVAALVVSMFAVAFWRLSVLARLDVAPRLAVTAGVEGDS